MTSKQVTNRDLTTLQSWATKLNGHQINFEPKIILKHNFKFIELTNSQVGAFLI